MKKKKEEVLSTIETLVEAKAIEFKKAKYKLANCQGWLREDKNKLSRVFAAVNKAHLSLRNFPEITIKNSDSLFNEFLMVEKDANNITLGYRFDVLKYDKYAEMVIKRHRELTNNLQEDNIKAVRELLIDGLDFDSAFTKQELAGRLKQCYAELNIDEFSTIEDLSSFFTLHGIGNDKFVIDNVLGATEYIPPTPPPAPARFSF